jgi:hypothetical protein
MPTERLHLAWAEKNAIIAKITEDPTMSYANVAQWAVMEFSLPVAPGKSTIHDILASRVELQGRPVEGVTLDY